MTKRVNKSELVKEMRSMVKQGYFITRPEFCTYLGISTNTAKGILRDVEAINGRYYHIPDVADAIIDRSYAE